MAWLRLADAHYRRADLNVADCIDKADEDHRHRHHAIVIGREKAREKNSADDAEHPGEDLAAHQQHSSADDLMRNGAVRSVGSGHGLAQFSQKMAGMIIVAESVQLCIAQRAFAPPVERKGCASQHVTLAMDSSASTQTGSQRA
jgi:hypothetical protein